MHRSPRRSIAEIRLDDPSVTGHAGLLLVKELAEQHHLVERLDAAIDGVHAFKQRRRGLSGGELLVTLAESMLVGGDHLAHLEVLRQDQAGAGLRTVAEVPALETASLLLPRFWQRQLEAAVKVVAEIGNEVDVAWDCERRTR
ncbi:MAG TPA: hypothetical protein VMU49_02550 [Candidatus Acidoferrales bacterium]|nr:hypothetical protein [Candidatus Acidoferrales bacterium]